jgi:hypothetical protein
MTSAGSQAVEQVARSLCMPGGGARFWTFVEAVEQCDNLIEMIGPGSSSNHRKIGHGIDVIVLEIREVLHLAQDCGGATELLTVQAFLGDLKAIQAFKNLALSGSPFVLKVVALLKKLLTLATQVEVLVTESAELTAQLSAPQFDDVATQLTNELLLGTIHRNAPPVIALSERGEQSDSIRSERSCMK